MPTLASATHLWSPASSASGPSHPTKKTHLDGDVGKTFQSVVESVSIEVADAAVAAAVVVVHVMVNAMRVKWRENRVWRRRVNENAVVSVVHDVVFVDLWVVETYPSCCGQRGDRRG